MWRQVELDLGDDTQAARLYRPMWPASTAPNLPPLIKFPTGECPVSSGFSHQSGVHLVSLATGPGSGSTMLASTRRLSTGRKLGFKAWIHPAGFPRTRPFPQNKAICKTSSIQISYSPIVGCGHLHAEEVAIVATMHVLIPNERLSRQGGK